MNDACWPSCGLCQLRKLLLQDNVIDAVSNVSSRYIVSLKNALGISRSEVLPHS